MPFEYVGISVSEDIFDSFFSLVLPLPIYWMTRILETKIQKFVH